MSKIKLSTLLLISFFVFSCANNQINNSNQKYSIAYIGGGYDGLLLKNYLTNGLKNLKIYEQDSNFEIQASINHSSNLYITNINNTSDREKINTKLSIKIINKKSNCISFNDEIIVSQFYIYASSNKFLSNQAAVKKLKKDNTKSTVRQFINKLKRIDGQCND
jgi:hypothetical protein